MKKTAALLIGACIMMASYAHAGFNGNQNVQGNNGNASGAGNSDFGQCINGQGKNGGQCAGNTNTGAKPKEKDKGEVMNAICESPFMKKYSPLCQ
ncbi:hypothetical protein ABK864_16005 [Serratia marcescens]|jgi:hypothetical protein|uniref:Exported protein n=1 Tax=Serratia marcescens subsp. marcescens Db11 TaxID=273526 RepID=A0ABC9IQX5_SERMA|nr:hypothetical protein [Serratia marcescens]MBH2749681.1 hypothetical protein [Serratia marcescens]MBH2935273.1 hypothetical protein [Serratia marcescens]MBH2967621.1 hypothetical protein [Serratia marcescens]MBK5575095.1 hypothetical protein [Serratia marcescens]MBN5344993.1 hypothetical protein [Serratia marcescens]